jgi:DNA-binding winged helix-turn-helix (wHTH) protein
MQVTELMCAPMQNQGNVLERKLAVESEVFLFGPYCLIPGRRLFLAGQDPVELGGRAFDILVLLVRHSGEIVSLRHILEQVWQDSTVDDANIRVQVSDLRRALQPECRRFIVTVHTRGYVFVGPVQHSPRR